MSKLARFFAARCYALTRTTPSCPQRSWILSKRINVSSKSVRRRAAKSFFPHQTSWQYSDRDPLTGASNASGLGTNRDRRRYSWLSIDYVLEKCDNHRAVYRTVGDARISEAIFITDCSMHDHDEEKNLRSTSCTIKATDRDKASRGLSATAGLLVCLRKLKAAGPRSRLLAYCDHFMGPKHQSFRNNFGRPQAIWIKICTGQQAIRFRKF